MFEGKFSLKPNKDGSYFIDRNGKHFEHILDYLRSGQINMEYIVRNCLVKHLLIESDFYHFPHLKAMLESQSNVDVNTSNQANGGMHSGASQTRIKCFSSGGRPDPWGNVAVKKCNEWLGACDDDVKILNMWSTVTSEGDEGTDSYFWIYVVYYYAGMIWSMYLIKNLGT
eukprot:UN09080